MRKWNASQEPDQHFFSVILRLKYQFDSVFLKLRD
jgi:hypothetical protein